ncbi:MAG TPA: hypothetical protein VG269_11645 [Tepidisphaeraceae bacterium]|nr:hypothetical protein [Tepidisphaeraceae bacterium]
MAIIWSGRIVAGAMGVAVLVGAGGCQWKQPAAPAAEIDRSPSGQVDVPAKQVAEIARQALAAPPMSMSVETGKEGSLVTGWREYPGDLHIIRRWTERTRFKIVIFPDSAEPQAKSHIQVFDETQEKPSDAQPWYPAPDRQRPERSAEVLKLIRDQAARGNPTTAPGK